MTLQHHLDKQKDTNAASDHGVVDKVKRCYNALLPAAEREAKKRSHNAKEDGLA